MLASRRVRLFLTAAPVLVSSLGISACSDASTVDGPTLRRVQLTQEVDGPEESRIAGAGCGVAFRMHGRLFQSVIPRSRLPEGLRRAAGLNNATDGREILHVETFSIPATVKTEVRDVAFACAADRTANRAAMRLALSSNDPHWMQLDDATVVPNSDSSAILTAVAADALMEPLIARAQKGRWMEQHDTLSLRPNAGALKQQAHAFFRKWGAENHVDARSLALPPLDAESAVQTAANRRRHDYQLPTVTIVGTQGSWLMNASDIYWLIHSWKYYDGHFAFAGYVDCAQASQLYLAQSDELERLEADSAELSQAVGSTDAFNCERQGGSLNICMDLFIVSKHAGPLNGDNRGLDSSAPYSASRVQVYLDLDHNEGKVYVNSSSTWLSLPSSFAQVDPYPHGPKALQISVQDSTHKIVSYEFYNGYCSSVPLALCPPTTGSVLFVKQANGTWVPTDVARVPYPTLAIYRDTGTSFQIQYNSPEGRWTELFGSHQALDKWRSKMRLPDGCYLQ